MEPRSNTGCTSHSGAAYFYLQEYACDFRVKLAWSSSELYGVSDMMKNLGLRVSLHKTMHGRVIDAHNSNDKP